MSTTTDDSVPFSPVPFSPFSDSVTVSETSDEDPDLGQFNHIFHTLTGLQPHPYIPAFNGLYPTPTVTSLSSVTERGLAIVRADDEYRQERGSRTAREDEGRDEEETAMQTTTSEVQNGSTVWHQQQIMSYFDFSTTHTQTASPSELIVAQFRHYPMQELDRVVQSAYGQQAMDQEVAPETDEGEETDDDGDGDDTESGMTVSIASDSGGEGLGFDSGEESNESDGEIGEEAVADPRPNGDIRQQSLIRVPLRPYSHQWDSEDLENADEFGPFDAATTASSGTRPTEHSESEFRYPVYRRQQLSPSSSVRDGLDGAGSVITSRTSPVPIESVNSMRSSSASLPSFPAHDDNTYYSDNLSLPERPSSLPVTIGHRAHHQHHHIFSSPFNDNSTRSSISISSLSSFSSTSSPPPSYPPWLQSRQSPPHFSSHARHINTAQPQLRLFNPAARHQQERSSGSASTVTTSDSTLTRRAGARAAMSMQSIFKEDDTISRATSQGIGPPTPVIATEQQAVHASDSDSQQQQHYEAQSLEPEDIHNRYTTSPSLSIVSDHHSDSSFDQSPQEHLSLHSTVMNAERELYYNPQHIPTLAAEGVERFDEEEPLPSLGFLDEALRFIAEERARFEAHRETGMSVTGGLSSDSERWKHELESSDSTHDSNTAPSMTRSTSNSAASASDLMLLSPAEHSKHTPRKKRKQKKTPVTSPINVKEKNSSKRGVSGNVTPVMAMSILRPDGTIIGGGVTPGMVNTNARTKRRSTGSDSYLGSGTLTPRVGGSGVWPVQGESTEPDAEELAGVDLTPKKKKKNKKGKEKDEKPILSHSQSVPEMSPAAKDDEEVFGPRVLPEVKKGRKYPSLNIAKAQTHAVNTKRARLQGLARQLQDLYPEDKRCLDRVLKSLASQKKEKGKGGRAKVLESSEEELVGRATMKGGDGDGEDEELDPRGRPPRKGDPLIHVFIDHSNILFGLLAYLRRHPPKRPLPPTPSSTISNASTLKPRHKLASSVSSTPPSPTDTVSNILPLPSFATARNSTRTQALVRINKREMAEERENGENGKSTTSAGTDSTRGTNQRHMRYLSHSALTLILERGRPVTRRVLVTSSPLYQPVDGMERLGYQVSIFLRVPDLGDGMDRDRHRDRPTKSPKRNSGSGYGSGSGPGSGVGIPIPKSPNKRATHARQVSGNNINGGAGDYLSVPGSKGTVSAPSSYGSPIGLHLHNAMLARSSANGHNHNQGNAGSGTPRIRYREQGVDELLQLKLHQALAAEDDVPAGATIVLATGDGNVGQFNEEGFLGPVRTALKRGWKVELYSWESGLSRAWKREFGRDSEWGKTGMFRIYGMEQFASSLVEDGWVAV